MENIKGKERKLTAKTGPLLAMFPHNTVVAYNNERIPGGIASPKMK